MHKGLSLELEARDLDEQPHPSTSGAQPHSEDHELMFRTTASAQRSPLPSTLGWKPLCLHETGSLVNKLLSSYGPSQTPVATCSPGAQLSALHTGSRHQLAKCLPRLLPPPHLLPMDQLLEAIHHFPTPGLPGENGLILLQSFKYSFQI